MSRCRNVWVQVWTGCDCRGPDLTHSGLRFDEEAGAATTAKQVSTMEAGESQRPQHLHQA